MAKRKAKQATNVKPSKAPRSTKATRLAILTTLALPWDIRERILRYVIGDRLIHFSFANDDPRESYAIAPSKYYELSVSEAFSMSVRRNTCPNLADKWPHAHGDRYLDEDYAVRARPRRWEKGFLSILSTSYQLYDEGMLVFWSTNTFSFRHSVHLSRFLYRLTVTQRETIESLHLTIHADLKQNGFYGFYWGSRNLVKDWQCDCNDWRSVLESHYLQQMRGLKILHLCIQCSAGVGLRPFDLDVFTTRPWPTFLEKYTLESLRCVRWKEVSVAFSGRLTKFIGMGAFFHDDRTIRYAEELRALLLGNQTITAFKQIDFEAKGKTKTSGLVPDTSN